MPIAAAASSPSITCSTASTARAGGIADPGPSTPLGQADEVLERPGRRELHRDHREALHLGSAEDVDDVGMAERRRQPSLLQEPLAFLVVADAAAENLDRDAAAAVALFDLVDLAHAALADRTDDDVGTETLAGGEEKRKVDRKAGVRWARANASRRRMTTRQQIRLRCASRPA